jgi:hypothetical protein
MAIRNTSLVVIGLICPALCTTPAARGISAIMHD